jgi:enediyne biosynthesis protein E4
MDTNPICLSRRAVLRKLARVAAAAPLTRPFAWAAPPSPASNLFEEISPSRSGIHWVHTAGKSRTKYLPESSGAGCAFFDYDNDGWMDIYLVNSGKCDFYRPTLPIRNALYRNNRDGTFTDVTEKAGVAGGGYGMGVAVGDYNGDGLPDLYVTQVGRNILYRNNGDGTFTDVTEHAGVGLSGWSTSAVWFDYDNDGRLDLFVCQFCEFDKAVGCPVDPDGTRHYCIPRPFKPRPSWLLHNNGDGTFTDVSRETGIAGSLGKAWGCVAADLDNDGRMDLFVANDTVADFLFMNRGGKFEETGFTANVAYAADGATRSGMGVDAADIDHDGFTDLFVANINEELFSLYRNRKDGTFDDVARAAGIANATRWMSGWGLKLFDYDNDGDIDLLLANGFPDDLIDRESHYVTYREPLLLFHNDGGRFRDVSGEGGTAFAKRFAARGLATGDFDNDGAVDVLITVNDGAPVLLRNTNPAANHWLGIKLIGRKCNPDAVGARVTYQAGDLTRIRTKTAGGSFLSAHDSRMVLGLGSHPAIDWIEVRWPRPSGREERFTNLPVNRYITLTEGTGLSSEELKG